MQEALYFWVEKYLFNPSFAQKILAFLLLPLSLFYCFIVVVKRARSTPVDFHIPIISVGNLIVGGSGKTPFTITLASRYAHVFIILRGYKRASTGLIMISHKGQILEDVSVSGDEAMLYATSLPNASVIVSKDRVLAIKKAKALGAKVIFLDDGFSKSHIQKLDILLKPTLPHSNNFCLPSGPFREPRYLYHNFLTLKEGKEFTRRVTITNPQERMVLITAISNPARLEPYVPAHIQKVYFPDHYAYKRDALLSILRKYQADTILTTTKDAVKMKDMGIELSILTLDIRINEDILTIIDTFIENFGKISTN